MGTDDGHVTAGELLFTDAYAAQDEGGRPAAGQPGAPATASQ